MAAPSKATPNGPTPVSNLSSTAPSLGRSRVTALMPLLTTQMFKPSNVTPAAPSPTGKTPSCAPSEARSLVTVPSKKLETQTFSPSKAAPNGPRPALNVPITAPVAPDSFVTFSLRLLATQRLAPSQAPLRGRVPPTGYVARRAPSRALSLVTELSLRFRTQILVPSATSPPGPLPTGKVPCTAPSEARSLVTVMAPRFATHTDGPSATTATGRWPTVKLLVKSSFTRTRVTVLVNCRAIQTKLPSNVMPSAPLFGFTPSGTSRSRGDEAATPSRLGACSWVWAHTQPSGLSASASKTALAQMRVLVPSALFMTVLLCRIVTIRIHPGTSRMASIHARVLSPPATGGLAGIGRSSSHSSTRSRCSGFAIPGWAPQIMSGSVPNRTIPTWFVL